MTPLSLIVNNTIQSLPLVLFLEYKQRSLDAIAKFLLSQSISFVDIQSQPKWLELDLQLNLHPSKRDGPFAQLVA